MVQQVRRVPLPLSHELFYPIGFVFLFFYFFLPLHSKPDWEGVCGVAPDLGQLEEAVATKDLYM